MHRTRTAGLSLLIVTGTLALPLGPARATAIAVDAPVHHLTVSGPDTGMYPAFDETVQRYAITTGAATAGTVTVTATSSDPGREITFNGVPDADGTRTVTGLEEGDEVAVFVEDAAGVARYSLVYLPEGFPTLERVTPDSTLDELAPGLVLLTLGRFTVPSSFFETAVDVNGVPAFVRTQTRALDLQRQPNGHYSVFRPTSEPGRTGWDLVELDLRHEPVRTWRTVGLVDTDSHDALLLPDGSAWLMAYEPNPDTGLVDAVVQHVSSAGAVLFSWTSAPYAGETMARPDADFHDDYAHINSFQVLPDGHLLVSLRHLSSVFKIATHDDGASVAGDVMWKLGGRDSDFTFPSGDSGPCAQHTARMLPDGNVLLFDNGSWSVGSQTLCVDPADPDGPSVARTQTRVVEFHLDPVQGTATPVRTYGPSDRFALFAGSSQRLPGGTTVIGWAAETKAMASEVGADGELLWEIRDPSPEAPFFSYRAPKAEVPDDISPEISVTVPAVGASYVEGEPVVADYECVDSGGSGLATCGGTATPGAALDTSDPGRHTVTVTASDGAGGTTTETRAYTVLPAARPDASVRVQGNPMVRGVDQYGSSRDQRLRVRIARPGGRTRAYLRLTNDGAKPDRLAFAVRNASRWFRVAGRCAGGGTSPELAPGETWVCRLWVKRRTVSGAGHVAVIRMPVRSVADPSRRDAVSLELRS